MSPGRSQALQCLGMLSIKLSILSWGILHHSSSNALRSSGRQVGGLIGCNSSAKKAYPTHALLDSSPPFAEKDSSPKPGHSSRCSADSGTPSFTSQSCSSPLVLEGAAASTKLHRASSKKKTGIRRLFFKKINFTSLFLASISTDENGKENGQFKKCSRSSCAAEQFHSDVSFGSEPTSTEDTRKTGSGRCEEFPSRQTIDNCVCNGLMITEPGKLIGTKLSFQKNYASVSETMMAAFVLDAMAATGTSVKYSTARSRSLPSRQSLELSFSRIMHAHTLQRLFGDFCSTQHMQLLPWPAYSPDMSPIEHVWVFGCDEAHFWLNGYINIWSEANPQVYVGNTVTSRKTDRLVRFMGWWNPSSKTMKATTLQSMVIGIEP
ncbi:transposable element Tcb2 transposase [Trichonephila clavipes]|nr:transposable element Tcb2 transposase [Trichonephila clavipes]